MHLKIKKLFSHLLYWGSLLFLFISIITYNSTDPSLNNANTNSFKNLAGALGAYISDLFIQLLGVGSFIIIVIMIARIFLVRSYKLLIALLLPPCLLVLAYLPIFTYFPLSNYIGLLGIILLKLHLPKEVVLIGSSLSIIIISVAWYIFFYRQTNHLSLIKVTSLGVTPPIVKEFEPTEKFLPTSSEKNLPATPKLPIKKEKLTSLYNASFSSLPPIKLLTERKVDYKPKNNNAQKGKLLEQILADFGVEGKVIQISEGPVVTLYELEPSAGTKSSRVIGLANDIARSISAISARIAVIPGYNVLGIELPNEQREAVFLREVLEDSSYYDADIKLPIALGKSINGTPIIVDLTKMPHLLVAGTTGSGKSVGINAMLLSLLYRLTPQECKFILIDPKMLELSVYEGIPHLLASVVTEPRKAVAALKWVVHEMENRYRTMAAMSVRNIDGYNQKIKKVPLSINSSEEQESTEEVKLMPYIVVVVDEMADLMLVAGKDIETYIQRLAQMARAAGIHIIMATQRPSVDVITGVIKANFPTRISFAVTSKIDSRTILGEQGAEQLLGRGDMLYMAAGGSITRVHGPFVSDEEVQSVVQYLKMQAEPDYLNNITEVADEKENNFLTLDDASEENDLYQKAVAIILQDKKVSISYIQRKLKIGYNRAATIIEKMEKEKVISAANHSGKREILLK